MPIYEFYCPDCHMVFNFYSGRVDTTTQPPCPKCARAELTRKISRFATIRLRGGEEDDSPFAGMDESKMENAFMSLMQEAENVNEDDPKAMARLMRKFTDRTGLRLGDSMEEALSRMEAGEDPEQVEKEMGDVLDMEDFSLESVRRMVRRNDEPAHDETLYEL